jgi:5-formyltetrahydrofolate cyclo-ligase
MNIREQIIGFRKLISEQEKQDASRMITKTVMTTPQWIKAHTVCLYVSIPEEVDTSLLMRAALGDRKIVCIPRVTDKQTLTLFQIHTFDDLASGAFGIFEPKAYCKEVEIQSVNLFIVPGVAFDPTCFRMGWGRGYYDILLAGVSSYKIGLAHSCQIVPRLTHKKYDIPMDTVITEKEVYDANTH